MPDLEEMFAGVPLSLPVIALIAVAVMYLGRSAAHGQIGRAHV